MTHDEHFNHKVETSVCRENPKALPREDLDI